MFLGFTDYCAKGRKGRLIIVYKTSKINLAGRLKEIKEWLKIIRNRIWLKDCWQILIAKLRGHYNYFGISGNYLWLSKSEWTVNKLTFKWINRLSHKKSVPWEQFMN